MIEPNPHRSRTVSEMEPHQKLFAAISIIQQHILAEDSNLVADKCFGVNHMRLPALELAESLLQDLVPITMDRDAEALERPANSPQPLRAAGAGP